MKIWNIWKNQIVPLEGKVISNGRISNKIVKVNLDGIIRLSSNNKESFINIEIFRSVINHIIHDGSITRSEVNDMYLKRYTSALIKRQWGANLSKFSGVEMLGGVTMNGGEIYSQAQEEITKLEEQIQLHFELPVNYMIG